MRYCLNPDCPEPKNSSPVQVCQACGSRLLLHGRYQALKALAKGGFGATFIGVDLKSPNQLICVIKQLRPATTSLEFLKMARDLFDREARTLQKIGSHSQIPMLLDYFESEGRFYLVQEYIRGWTIQQEIRRVGSFTEHAVKQFLVEILPVLQYVHDQHVIHRDIKPANIIRREADKKLVLIDFGAVKTQVSQTAIMNSSENTALTAYAIGTPGYAPPEQMAMRPVYSSDIYALGICCIYLLLGKPPKDWDYNAITGDMLWKEQLRISAAFLQILEKMTEVRVSDRYKSAQEVLRVVQLEPYMDSLSQGLTTQPHKTIVSQTFAPRQSKASEARTHVQTPQNTHIQKSQKPLEVAIQAKPTTLPPKNPIKWSLSTLIAAYEAGNKDFAEQQLSGLNLQGANLSKASFYRANLTKVNLQKANLSQVNFGGASLNFANLKEANLTRAYFSFADLEGADLRGADLRGVYFNNANLRGANLSGANLSGAKISHEQLALAKTNWATTLPHGKRGIW
ncbi:serine/threonine-protein kinase [Merismopedia glauca]|uniref:Serine/threonine-protein kinase B n=1 Tax=Merismopedia glauca CCAP 1448/3 TaxID=1296344 RepID=A0A2T1BXR5_9CYAN|nr:serine/threonine-protein kinase [Merismopedia glauca]PSB00782.1 serine/threonine protein kinase [Merismopedia glauca CCAP 1448/3]